MDNDQISILDLSERKNHDFDNSLYAALIHFMAEVHRSTGKLFLEPGPVDNIYRFDLKINGEAVNFKSLLERLHEDLNKRIQDEAVKLAKQIAEPVEDQIYELQDKLRDLINRIKIPETEEE